MSLLHRSLLFLGVASSACGWSWAQDAAGQSGCDQVADAVFEACIALGSDETSCVKLREVALETCTEAFPVGPAPGPCEILCEGGARKVFDDCLAAGGSTEECGERSAGFLRHCLEGCEVEPPPVPCEVQCEQLRAQMLASCGAADGQVDPECWQNAEAAYQACVAGCEGRPPPPDDCFTACQRRFDEFLNQCLAGVDPATGDAPGEPGDPNECHVQAQQILEECMASCQGTQPPDCPTSCAQLRDDMLRSCLEQDGEVDGQVDPECARMAEEAFQACLAGCEGRPPPPEDCPAACQRRFDEFLNQCLAGVDPATGDAPGEPGDPNECHVQAQQMLDECLASCEGTAPGSSCEDRCKVSSEVVFQECLQTGNSAEDCAARMTEYADACLLRCGENEPPPSPIECPDLCESRGQEMLSMCLARNLDPAECEARRTSFVEECTAQCDHGAAASCEDLCASSARQSLAGCLESGGDPEACRQRADRILEACITNCDQSQPSTCDQGCGDRARSLLSRCLESGGSSEDCRKETSDFLERCLAACGGDDAAEPPPCADRCAESARLLVRECIERGGEEDECQAEAAPYLARCLQRCEEPAPAPEPCDQPCEEIAESMRLRCAAAGAVDQACLAAVDAFLAQCRDSTQEVCDRNEEGTGAAPVVFLRGDFNRDKVANISDPIGILGYLFLGKLPTPCEDAADANDDGHINISDPIILLNHLFCGGGDLPAPSGSEGHDPTSDGLICSP